MARPEGVKVDRISLGLTFKNDQFYFNDTLYKHVWPWRLLQGDRPRFEKLILSDISIHLTFTSVHPGQLGNLVGLAPWGRMTTSFKPNEKEKKRVPNGDEVAQMVIEQFKVPVAGDLAKKNEELTSEKILKNVENLDSPVLKDYFDVISYHYGEATVSDTAKFAFIIEDPRYLTNQNSYFLGSEFSFAAGQTAQVIAQELRGDPMEQNR
ncbi:10025_t:CDS:2 [Gigaspora rosea]|nr:10025_t:CDS:2 [Gigaspora rosea]